MTPWDIHFPNPIEMPSGRRLITLRDAGRCILALPTAEQLEPAWQNAMSILIQTADHLGPVEFARLAPMQARYPETEPVCHSIQTDAVWRNNDRLVRDR